MKHLTNIRALGALVLLVAVSAAPPAARAAEVQVLSAGAMRSIVTDLGAAFEKETGHTLKFSFATVGQIKAKLADATPVDVVIMTDDAMREMARQGAVVEGSWTAIGRTGIGVAVRDGAPKPDIGSPEALKQALLATKSLTYIDPAQGGTSGIHFAGVLQKLGIADAVKPKTTLVPGGYPAELVAKGDVEMVVHQISEIIPVPGVKLVGELPAQFQRYTVYVAVPMKDSKPVQDFIAHVTSPQARERLAKAGYTAPQ